MSVQSMSPFQKRLKTLMKEYVHYIYKIAKQFPKEELFSSCSQLKRAGLSILLNYVEGFTRIRTKVQLNFFEISYGSLHESLILLEFALEEEWINQDQFDASFKLSDEIGAMLWTEIEPLNKKIEKTR